MANISTSNLMREYQTAVSLLFRKGQRPDIAAVRRLANQSSKFSATIAPGSEHTDETGREWIELLASGLTYDLVGLSPGPTMGLPERRQGIGVADIADAELEAITLRPGPHLRGGAKMLPVIRTITWLAAVLSELEGVYACCWHPAACWNGPDLFRQNIDRWIEGGVFPGLTLASLAAAPDGGLQSRGLAVFSGQELRLEPEVVSDRAEAAKLALRLMDFLVLSGRLDAPDTILGPDGTTLRMKPSENGLFVRIFRG